MRWPRFARSAVSYTLLLLCALCNAEEVEHLMFELGRGETKCLREFLGPNIPLSGEVRVVDSDGHSDMAVGYSLIQGLTRKVYFSKLELEHGHEKFSIVTASDPRTSVDTKNNSRAEYKLCIFQRKASRGGSSKDKRKVYVTLQAGIDPRENGRRQQVLSQLTRKTDVDGFHNSLRRFERVVREIRHEIYNLRIRENKLSKEAASTANDVVWTAIVACLCIVAAGAFQSVQMRTMLKKRHGSR